MAAVIQNQIRRFEQIVKPYLYEGPLTTYWGLFEQKTKFKREQLALVLLALAAIYLTFGWCNDVLCNFIGLIFPIYASVLAVESKATQNDTEWLVYWVVYSSFGFIEYFGYNFFHSLSFYWLGKCLFLIWLMTPGQNGGSHVLYQRLIRPFVHKNQSTVDKHIQDIKTQVSGYQERARDY